MRKIKLLIQYRGKNYRGWQVQPNGITIQGLLEGILAEIFGEKTLVFGSGRTDSGVHALAQVAHFSTNHSMDLETLRRALNAHLPHDVAVLSAEEVPADFDAQRSAKLKTYSYFILNSELKSPFLSPYSWKIHGDLDLESMRECLELLVGEHDFASFKAADSFAKTSRRRIDRAELRRIPLTALGDSLLGIFGLAGMLKPLAGSGDFHPEAETGPALLAITLQGPGFLKHMVRNIVGTLVEVGMGKMDVAEFRRIFEAKDRTQAGPTAPAWGLFLVDVDYGD